MNNPPTPNAQRPTPNAQRPTPNAPRPTPHAPRPTPHAPRPTPHAPRPTPHAPRPTPSTRVTILYAGRVQGVGFRASAANVARKFAVTGTVRNLPDGRVELVAEGEPNTVAAFLAAVAGRMRSHIDGVERTVVEARGEFDAFDVAH